MFSMVLSMLSSGSVICSKDGAMIRTVASWGILLLFQFWGVVGGWDESDPGTSDFQEKAFSQSALWPSTLTHPTGHLAFFGCFMRDMVSWSLLGYLVVPNKEIEHLGPCFSETVKPLWWKLRGCELRTPNGRIERPRDVFCGRNKTNAAKWGKKACQICQH